MKQPETGDCAHVSPSVVYGAAAASLTAKAFCREAHLFFMELQPSRIHLESRKALKGSDEAQR